MGIKNLSQLLKSDASNSYTKVDIKSYKNEIIAIDSSILLYQFLIQIRSKDNHGYSQLLVDSEGEITSHIQGFLNRTANLLELGIKPVFVFDGKAPDLKFAELQRRKELKKKALEDSLKASDPEEYNKAQKRNIHITTEQTQDIKKLLILLGVPVITAPGEAEAQCAEFVKSGKAYGTATEDMDALTFGTGIVLRKFTGDEKVTEINLHKVLSELELSYDQFIDLCILCGCDYTDTIRGIGPKTALKLIHEYGDIENLVKNVKKYKVPQEDWIENLKNVRKLFKEPLVDKDIEFTFNEINVEGLLDFLVEEKGFNKDRVLRVIDRIVAGKTKKSSSAIGQPKIDTFFKLKN